MIVRVRKEGVYISTEWVTDRGNYVSLVSRIITSAKALLGRLDI